MSAIKHKRLCFLFTLSFSLTVFSLHANYALADSPTIVTENISVNTTWSLENSPYIVENNISIFSDVILTIDPGVVVKFDGVGINIYGSIVADGTQTEPIYFTSKYDADVGGNTGDLLEPFVGDWEGLYFQGPISSSLKNVFIRYSHDSLVFGSSPASIENLDISDGFYGLTVYGNSQVELLNGVMYNIERDAVAVYDNGSLDLKDVVISNVFGDAFGIYGGSLNAFGLIVNNINFGSALGIYNGDVVVENSKFEDGLATGIEIYGGSLGIKNSLVSGYLSGNYASYRGVSTLDGVSMENSDYGVSVYGGEVNILKSFFKNIFVNAVENYGDFALRVENSWWGDKTGPFHGVLNPGGLGGAIYGDVSFIPFCKNVSCTTRNPVLIVPGVLGTEISRPTNDGLEKLWLDLGRNLTDIKDEFMDALQFNDDLTPMDTSLTIGDVIGKVLFSDYSGGLRVEFKNQGYVEGTDLFLFPYDWRFGVSEDNINKLKQKITDILVQSGESKVDVIAHSTGGLLVKKYVVDNPADHNIDKAVFVGVPNTGAPKAIKNLLVGDNFGNLLLDDGEMKKLSRNFPVAYDLSPSEQYFNAKGSYIKIISKPFFASTPKDLNFEEANSFLIDDHDLNAEALANARSLHTLDFDNYDLRTTGVDLYAIDGCTAGTIGKVVEVRQASAFNDPASPLFQLAPHPTYQLEYVPGDGTVPLESATNLPIDEENKYYALQGKHSSMLSQEGTRQQIVNIISGSILSTQDGKGTDIITQDISKCKLDGRAISVFSPLSISVVDQDGNHAGLASDGVSIENNIPNAELNIIGEHKFVYLPTDAGQTYTISVAGTGTGTFTITDASISQNNITQTQVFSNISVRPSLLGNISLSTTTTLTLDTNGDGVSDQTLEATSVLDATQSQNFVPEPPVTSDPPAESNNASLVSGGGGGGRPPVVSPVNPVTQPVESVPVASITVIEEIPVESKIIKQDSTFRAEGTLASTSKVENIESAPVLAQIENLVPESTLVANVADTNAPIGGKVALTTLAVAVVSVFLGKKFIRV